MDEGAARESAERHAATLQSGNLPAAFGELTDQAKTELEPYVLNFPSPVERAGVLSLALRPEGYVAEIEISGGGRELRLRTTWAEVGGRPMIVAVRGAQEP